MTQPIAFVKASEYNSVASAVRKSLDLLGGIGNFLQPGMKVLLKPNLLFGVDPAKCVTTHPEIIRAVISIVRKAGAYPVMGDSPVIGTGSFHSKRAGYRDLCAELQVPWIDFENDAMEVEGKHAFKKITIARIVHEADAIINLPKVKTHGQAYLTLSVKNMFGIIPGVRKAQWHLTSGVDPLKFAEMLVEVCYLRKPVLNIVDGIMAMHGNGPRNGKPYPLGFIIAGADPSAVDKAICYMLGVKAEKVPTLIAASKLGVGETRLENLRFLGDHPEDAKVKGFQFVGQHLPSDMGKLNFLAPFARKATTSRPVIDHQTCTCCNQCVDHCPALAMRLDGKVEAGKVLIDLDKCIRCYCCSEICPEGSVSVGQGWLWKFVPGMLK